ncbi:prepilin peptidase [Magnetovibrio sp. PR-2]|uniref:A24 family peptidase n=1 Tax=Magnetovibrio sp. PR-2 TaxID=3120356 RepID=UPI002FCE39B8
MLLFAFDLVFVVLMLYAAWSDARFLRIPNWLSMTLLVVFFPTVLAAGLPMEAIAWHFGAGVAVLVAGFVLFAIGLLGGGDAKLLAVCALWLGIDQVLWLLAAVVLIGGVLSIAVILLRKGLGLWPDWLVRHLKGLFEPNAAVPYGIAITAGALLVFPRADLFAPGWLELWDVIVG